MGMYLGSTPISNVYLGSTSAKVYLGTTLISGTAYPQLAVGSKFRINGDSIFGRGHGGSSPGDGLSIGRNNGAYEVAFGISPRLNFEAYPANNGTEHATYNGTATWVDGGPGAVPGTGIDYHEFLVTRTLAMDPDLFALSCTVNSRAVPNVVNRYIALWETYIAAGIIVIPGIMAPIVAGASFDDSAYQTNRSAINAAIKDWAATKSRSQVPFVLDWDEVLDPARTGYCTNPSYLLSDGVHVSPIGASYLGDYINSKLDLIIAPGPDLFDQYWSNLTNYHPNPTLTGTGGSRAGSWASGSVLPAGYRGFNSTATWSGVISTVEANASTGGQNCVLPIIPKSTSVDTEIFTFLNTSLDNNGTISNASLDGKYVIAGAEIEVDAGIYNGTPSLYLIGNGNAASTYSRSLDVDSGNGNSPQRQGKAVTFKLITDPMKIDAGITQCRVQLTMRFLGALAWADTGASQYNMRVKRMALWDIGSPRSRWNQ